MSIDHKPGRKGERRRILRSGGYLDETDPKHPRVVRDNYNVRTVKEHPAFILEKLRVKRNEEDNVLEYTYIYI